MNSLDFLVVNVHKILNNGSVISSIRHEMDPNTKEVISRTYFTSREMNLSTSRRDTLYLNWRRFEVLDIKPNCIRLRETDFIASPKPALNIPTMIRCQNCETNFPTKYQYQRHQCEFNAEKVILKPELDAKDMDKNARVKYICQICDRQFVSRSNLERHESSHEKTQETICEHCNKKFVSENRLRIHKENHCKKVGDISKFYRSDVTVWKCKKCQEVFSSLLIANHHMMNCTEEMEIEFNCGEDGNEIKILEEEEERKNVNQDEAKESMPSKESKYLEKTLTELLFQCEFCNRTYSEKNNLLLHQRKHSTAKNYECSNCFSAFDSFATAVQHWLKKCTDFVNVFFLPRFTYCECCDRSFKSHELLYTHKIKKKHYTSKIHVSNVNSDDQQSSSIQSVPEKPADSKEVLSKLIEDVLKTLDVPINKVRTSTQFVKLENHVNIHQNSTIEDNLEIGGVQIESNEDSYQTECNGEILEKKKRGRKRKWLQRPQLLRQKKMYTSNVESGFKYQCERCIKVFDAIVELDGHREKEHASNFTCEECGQVLQSAKALLIHCRAHKSLKPYVCETCGRSYSQTSHLWQHMRFHQGIKPFACPHEGCEARYTIRPDLKDHIRKVHTRERPFKCNVCNKCFLTGSVYYQHRLIHTNDRRYACDLCPKRFFRADALNNHRRIHTDERPYPCHVCGREFRQKGDRNKHLRTQHPETLIDR